MPDAIRTENLSREYRGRGQPIVLALSTFDLSIREGEVVGLLGPNGAGKTTIVKVLSTILLPTSGKAFVLGHDVVREPQEVRARIGIVLGGDRGLYDRLTASENLLHWGAMYGLSSRLAAARADELLTRVGLEDRASQRVETFSRGMKQRLHLARGLVGDPEVAFLDEPTAGLDPIAAHEFRGLLSHMRRDGRTILLATHDMAEAESLCDRVALVDRGRLLAFESPRRLASWISDYERVELLEPPAALLEEIARVEGVRDPVALDDGWTRVAVTGKDTVAEVLRLAVTHAITGLRTTQPTLEEVYLEVFGGRGRPE